MAGTDAAGTDLDGSDIAVSDSFNLLQVWIPDSSGFIICMTYIVTKAGAFATNLTFS